jgi:predicted metal-dependent enzyme (double-stranded beta helix superfamily)
MSSSKPKALRLSRPVEKVNLIIHGQGVVQFNATSRCCLSFYDASGTCGIRACFTERGIIVNAEPSNEPLVDPHRDVSGATLKAPYWFSLDSQNRCLRAGIGEARIENILYSYKFPDENKGAKKFLESLVTVCTSDMEVTTLLRDPITCGIPLLVKPTDELTMDDIAAGSYLPVANLSLMSQKLYDCISGKRFALDTPDFPNFTRAIERSIATPGLWCYERLKQKASEFDKDKPNDKETYLRITLGENNGESPGIPYVMEIWPVGHFSPVHNHGGSSAVIRVLHGAVNVTLFPYLGVNVTPFAAKDFKKGDVTWISPSLNQVHQLRNLDTNKATCITIQCYMYEGDDTTHYDYFDYLDGDGKTQQFEPDSDMGFAEFKRTMKVEWAARSCWGV